MKYLLLLFITLLTVQSGERTVVDSIGFSTNPEQAEAVIRYSRERSDLTKHTEGLPRSPMLSAICPHDDHIYAGPLYLPVMERVQASHLILIGVFHKAWKWNSENVLIFEDFQSWKAPWGPFPVDTSFRSAVLEELPDEDYTIKREYHEMEHSLEAFLAFLQYFNPESSILPVLVPYMKWETMDQLARHLSEAVAKVMKKNGWQWGKDIQILISNDSVHYGDQGWGGKNYAPFGTGVEGLARAKDRDLSLIHQYLLGSIEPGKLKKLLYLLVDEENIRNYEITWCGRFSVPFGVAFTYHLSRSLDRKPPRGQFLGYGTSVEMGELPVREVGLGVTAPANLHHWVAYTAIGYF